MSIPELYIPEFNCSRQGFTNLDVLTFFINLAIDDDESFVPMFELLSQLPTEKPLRILEIGCGSGRLLRSLSLSMEHIACYISSDINPSLIELLKIQPHSYPFEHYHYSLDAGDQNNLESIIARHNINTIISHGSIRYWISHWTTLKKFCQSHTMNLCVSDFRNFPDAETGRLYQVKSYSNWYKKIASAQEPSPNLNTLFASIALQARPVYFFTRYW